MHTEREELEALVDARANARNECDVCGRPMTSTRWRCVDCPPPARPEIFRLFRDDLRRRVVKQ